MMPAEAVAVLRQLLDDYGDGFEFGDTDIMLERFERRLTEHQNGDRDA